MIYCSSSQYQKDLLTFQCDVNLISQWTLQNHLSTNCNKTKYMFIPAATISISHAIYVNNNQIERIHGYKYLGSGFLMTLLGLSILTVSTCKRSQRLLHVLHLQNIFSALLPWTPFSIYTRLILDRIVWDPQHKKDQLLLEKVQPFAARLAIKS